MKFEKLVIKIADEIEREEIYKLRYEVYAKELHQHKENKEQKLKDDLDEYNTFLVTKINGNIAGFISITPPNKKYGLDKYISRNKFPYIYDNMFEGRLFTVLKEYRGSSTNLVLMFAFFRFIEEQKGDKIMTYGRIDLVDFYKKMGFEVLGETIHSGEVKFELMFGKTNDMRNNCGVLEKLLKRILPNVDNQLPFSLVKEEKCYHGGAFFEAIGDDFKTLHKSREVINADVLDAWFDPSPNVTNALKEYLPYILKTSPPTHSEGLVRVIAEKRGVMEKHILAGAGSSDLMYLALPQLLHKNSKVLLLNPTYGEYNFILKNVIDCKIDYFQLKKEDNYVPNLQLLMDKLKREKFDLFIIVNPNSPTGQYIKKEEMKNLIKNIPSETLVWIDETYIEYTGRDNSLEQVSTSLNNVIVCKSMSKVYALSGVRCAYFIGNEKIIDKLRLFSPPWAVSLPAQIAGVNALQDIEYYEKCYEETHRNKENLIADLEKLNKMKILKGVTNSILCEFPFNINASFVLKECAKRNLFIRNVENMGQNWGKNILRIAVKNKETNVKIAEILKEVLEDKASFL